MAKMTTVEVRMTMEEDPEILDITGTISEMKIVDSEQSKKLENEAVDVRESENPEILFNDETTTIQQLRSNSGDEKVSEPDQDQDQAHPAYIPRTGQFFMHDTRETGEKIKQYPLSRADCKWQHDLYNETDQIPISDREFANKYGIDRKGNFVPLIFILKLLQELFSASRQDARSTNQIRTRVPTNIWNTPRHFMKTHRIYDHGINYQERRKRIKRQESENRLSSASDIMNKEDRENEKLDGGEETESGPEIYNTDHKNTKLEMRFGKRYSTQRPVKSDKT